ncbi:MAG: hypothetical protein WCT49_02695 [Candidatus Paceibacterota bacterium]|nr:hypothetical protein [Candidatus Paceibacterota bacterium]
MLDLLEAYFEDLEKKLDKQAVLDAHNSYFLAKNAEAKKLSAPSEETILEILRILSEESKTKSITHEEIDYVRKLLFWDNKCLFMGMIENLQKKGKVVYHPRTGWTLAPPTK